MIMNGSVALTPASTGVLLTTVSTSHAISFTMALAFPYGMRPGQRTASRHPKRPEL